VTVRGTSGRIALVERDEALARLRAARVGRLATLTPEGKPHVVPFVFVVAEQGSAIRLFWMVDEKPKRSKELQRLRNIEHQPAVELIVDEYDDEDWTRLWWVRARGRARVVVEADERDAALGQLRAKYPQYDSTDDPGLIVAIEVETITGWESKTGSAQEE
jgi:PPOX class probable F420-dependent enzyme